MKLRRKLLLLVLASTILIAGIVFTLYTPGSGKTYDSLINDYYDQVFSTDTLFQANLSLAQPIAPDTPVNYSWYLNATIGDDLANCKFHTRMRTGAYIVNVNASGTYIFNTTVYFNGYKALSMWHGYCFIWKGVDNWSIWGSGPSTGSGADLTDYSRLRRGANNVSVYVTIQTDFEGNATYNYPNGSSQTYLFHTGLGYCEATAGPFMLFVTYELPFGGVVRYIAGSAIAIAAGLVIAFVASEKEQVQTTRKLDTISCRAVCASQQ